MGGKAAGSFARTSLKMTYYSRHEPKSHPEKTLRSQRLRDSAVKKTYCTVISPLKEVCKYFLIRWAG